MLVRSRFALELQRGWAREETAKAIGNLAIAHGGAYGVGIGYYRALAGRAKAMG